MSMTRTFKIPFGEDIIVFVPETKDLFLVDASQEIPDEIEIPDEVDSFVEFPSLKFGSVQLITNNTCNMRCEYCYANAGEIVPKIMNFEVAKAAIDKVAADASAHGLSTFEVNLIGGEPTCVPKLLHDIVDYCHSVDTVAQPRLTIVTNGYYDEDVAEYLAKNFHNITVSIDGWAEIHDSQRMNTSGGPTFATIDRNIKKFMKAKVPLGIRATITEQSVSKISEILEFFNTEYPGVPIGIEPIQECGRCIKTKTGAPNTEEFFAEMSKAIHLMVEKNIMIRSSILLFANRMTDLSFCGINGKSFSVNPEGLITSCTRVTDSTDPIAPLFMFGKYDEVSKEFVFDESRLSWLRGLTVENIDKCKDCFAQFNCKGDCPSMKANLGEAAVMQPSERCEHIKKLTLDLFKMQLGI
jgi:uncharacterized protein